VDFVREVCFTVIVANAERLVRAGREKEVRLA